MKWNSILLPLLWLFLYGGYFMRLPVLGYRASPHMGSSWLKEGPESEVEAEAETEPMHDLDEDDEEKEQLLMLPLQPRQHAMPSHWARNVKGNNVDAFESMPEFGQRIMDLGHMQLAANIASKAAQVATAANDAQSSAAECAANEVRIQLAEKAVQASRAVQAVLEGKRNLLEKIECELHTAEALLAKLDVSLQQSEYNAEKSKCAAKSAKLHFKRLNQIVQLFGSNVADADELTELAKNDYNEKQQMLIAAKERRERIKREIAAAREEYEHVKMAAYQAACAAAEAKQRAAHGVMGSGIHSYPSAVHRQRRRQRQRHYYLH